MEELKKKSLNAILWDLGGSFGQKGISFIISIFLARLLLPEEFGLVGMAMVFIGVFQIFSDVGFASALIHNQETTSTTYSSVFYLNVVLGGMLTAIIYFAAPLAGNFYGNQEVTVVLQWLSLMFIMNAFNIVQQTILRKELDMKTLNIRTFLAQMGGGIVGITMAFMDYGVYSLIGQNLVSSLTVTIFLWSVTDWYPRWEFSYQEVKKLTGYSSYIFFDQIMSRIFKEMDTLFIGKVFTAATLGFYSRAKSLNTAVTQFSSQSIRKVFFPVLSKLQHNDERYFDVYYKLVAVVGFLAFGLTGVLFTSGESLIILLFGQKWEPSVLIFQILILNAFTYPINIMVNNALLAKGKSKENFWMGIFRKMVRILPLVIGYYWGLESFLIAVVGVSYFLTISNIAFLNYIVGVSVWKHLRVFLEGGILLLLTVLLYYNFAPFTHVENFLWALMYGIIYLGFSYTIKNKGMMFLLRNGMQLIKEKM